jgi:secreted trypsin-like serine protease
MEYTVAILENDDEICTGTLVDTRLIVTAAHCTVGLTGTIEAFFGFNSNRPWTGDVVAVDSWTPHPSYNPISMANDIGVMELAADAPVAPAPMLDSGIFDNSWVGETLRFVGYGSTTWYGAGSGKRRAVDIEVDAVDTLDFTYYDNNYQTCYGDSGGPAFADYDGQWQLIGVTSWGDYYCNTMGVDTRVDAYLTWIEGYMGGGNPPANGDEVVAGVETTGSLAEDEIATFWFATQAGYQYDVILDATAGDADLYTHPTDDVAVDDYTCRPYLDGTEIEACTITGHGDGEYWILVHGYNASSYQMMVAESPDGCHTGFNGQARYCRNSCNCGYGLGSCNSDYQCADGLVCDANVGADFGMPSFVDVCVYP